MPKKRCRPDPYPGAERRGQQAGGPDAGPPARGAPQLRGQRSGWGAQDSLVGVVQASSAVDTDWRQVAKEFKGDEEDPLLLDGCKVRLRSTGDTLKVSWRRKLNKYRLRRSSEGPEEQAPLKLKPTQLLRRIEKYKVNVSGHTVSEFEVLRRGEHEKPLKWSKKEDNAIRARHLAGERYASIAISLGRTRKAVTNRGIQLLHRRFSLENGSEGLPVYRRAMEAVREVATDWRQVLPELKESEEESEEDPLLLDGCTVRLRRSKGKLKVSWRKKVKKYKLRSSKGPEEQAPLKLKPAQVLRRIAKYKVRVTHHTVSEFQVIEQGSHQPKQRWTKAEDTAIRARHLAGERYHSLARSLGRTKNAVKLRGNRLLNPSYTPASGTGQGVRTGARVNYRLRATQALRQLPGCRGTAQEICEKIQQLPGMSDMLDTETYPGEQTRLKWWKMVSNALSKNREFRRVGDVGRKTIWKLIEKHVPAKHSREAAIMATYSGHEEDFKAIPQKRCALGLGPGAERREQQADRPDAGHPTCGARSLLSRGG